MPLFKGIKVFSGNAHPALTKDICSYLDISPARSEVFKFSNDETFVRVLENIREEDVFLVQPISKPVNEHLMELWIMIDAARRASAGRITAVIPYYAYGRTDKKDQPRVAITARLVADFITAAGADRVLTMNLHAGQIQGFFNIPLDELDATDLIAEQFRLKNLEDLIVVAPDVGAAKMARDMADKLNCPMAIIEKQRIGNSDTVKATNVIGDVTDKVALILDGEIDTGGSVAAAAKALTLHGAKKVFCGIVHPILSGDAPKTLTDSVISGTIVTDTLPIPKEKQFPELQVVSVANLLGEAIRRIHNGMSVGAMFERKELNLDD
jgi:ribose-phosphate pyrophosphokinase